jgi:hypothetical protein
LWPIRPLAAFDLGEFGNQRPSPAVQEVEDRLALRLKAEARFPLPIRSVLTRKYATNLP